MMLLIMIGRPLHHFLLFVLTSYPYNVVGLPQPIIQDRDNAIDTCANIPSPVEVYLDTAVRVRKDARKGELTGSIRSKLQTANPDDPYSCSENKSCGNGACCGKNGVCGYGPIYCGTNEISPNDACWSNCNAKAPCGKFAATPNATCPLNVCCSQYGFCGVTDEFCQEECQSNCEQPSSSGKSNGDVQSRIIGYYEGWKYNADCSGVSIRNIPVGSLTHLHLAFGYITPGSYDIAMMPGVPDSVITDVMALKQHNPGIKMIISLGGWTFSDNGNDTQPVFGDIVSSTGNQLKFISKLLAFVNQYGFDGVDFDWEYPGAGDRGGNPVDGTNFEKFLFALELINLTLPKRLVVSFTTPTSYWYLQHFDLAASIQWVDWTNLMAYDLHGTWDGPEDQIGKIILAHTNLTEISTALSLFWRNGVDPAKINLGIGFYGRSFQLADPNCWQPGCPFKGGADAGECSGQSGILSYNEITNIIKKYDIDPYWDEDNAVKYLTWGGDQWVSYDDRDTFQQKIKYANTQGLGGLLIWAVDQDTPELDAMQALLYPKTLNAFANEVVDWEYWQEADQGVCHLSDCGKSCSTGEILISTQSCDGSYDADSVNHLCCPLASAPNPKDCVWRGNHAYCNGHCQPDEVPMMQNRWGNHEARCKDGNYVYCCKPSKDTGCWTTGCGGNCHDDEESMAGEFYDDCWFDPKQLCCKKPVHFDKQSCYWQGKPGSCYDNNCKFGVEIQLAESWDGGGKDCGWQATRQRVFCCTPSDSKSPFLPVPLEYLFKNPPTGDNIDTKFKLDVDNTFGGHVSSDNSDEPNGASFGFVIIASPETIQTSLDRRDGSHWAVFGCKDSVSVGEHTVQIACIDDSPLSNCYKIGLGHGVPGTILEMPEGCGPGRYAVAKNMTPAMNQTLPAHVTRRSRIARPVVYDLKFDYDFTRVPRDLGDTQIRIDYSNQEGYWNEIVNRAGDKRRKKRTLKEFGGSHRRWLEQTWREDHKGGLMSRSELHERWFGEDVVAWLKGLFSVAEGAPLIDHSISQTLTAILLQEQFQCNYGGVNVEANLDVRADLTAKIDTQFGLTIITKLTTGSVLPYMSQSFMYLRNRGDVDAVFTVDAIVKTSYDTGDRELFGLQNFNALFSVPGIITVGPNFKLFGSVNIDASISGHIEAAVNITSWDTQLSFPDQGPDYNPKNLKDSKPTTQTGKPDFDWSVEASGQITAHVKPLVSFGITWGAVFNKLPNCEIDLVVDGYATVYLKGSTTTKSVCYGVNTGANLFAQLDVPPQLNWVLPENPWVLGEWSAPIIPETCPISAGAENHDTLFIKPPGLRARLGARQRGRYSDSLDTRPDHGLQKRAATVIGPLLHLPFGLTCPTAEKQTGDVAPCPLCSGADGITEGSASGSNLIFERDDAPGCIFIPDGDETPCPAGIRARDLIEGLENATFQSLLSRDELEKRDRKVFTYQPLIGPKIDLDTGTFPNCGAAISGARYAGISRYYGYDANQQNPACVPNMFMNTGNEAFFQSSQYVVEHIFEAQTLLQFIYWLSGQGTGPAAPPGYTKPNRAWVEEYLLGYNPQGGVYFSFHSARLGPSSTNSPLDYFWNYMARGLGDGVNTRDLVLANNKMNRQKETLFQIHNPKVDHGSQRETMIYVRDVAAVFTYLAYIPAPATNGEAIWNKFLRPSNWVDLVCHEFDAVYANARVNNPVAGEPSYRDPITNAVRPGRIRWLWKAFIDGTMATIETRASTYCTAASQLFVASQQNPNPKYYTPGVAGWVTAAFGAGGWCNNPRMPRPGGTGSTYGAYGYAAMTEDYYGNQVNLGQPAA
ncbi:carbohydrate-binding module family 18 [Xylaria arbuscula]|nr:carbohydrate-binding module family 18 [Xylaria arbuscula]